MQHCISFRWTSWIFLKSILELFFSFLFLPLFWPFFFFLQKLSHLAWGRFSFLCDIVELVLLFSMFEWIRLRFDYLRQERCGSCAAPFLLHHVKQTVSLHLIFLVRYEYKNTSEQKKAAETQWHVTRSVYFHGWIWASPGLQLISASGSGCMSGSDGRGNSASNVSRSPWTIKLNPSQQNEKVKGG